MTYDLVFSKYYIKKVKKIVGKNKLLGELILNKLNELSLNPNNPKLRTHTVDAMFFGTCNSSRINGDLRIIWRYDSNRFTILNILNIGGHSGTHKVYT